MKHLCSTYDNLLNVKRGISEGTLQQCAGAVRVEAHERGGRDGTAGNAGATLRVDQLVGQRLAHAHHARVGRRVARQSGAAAGARCDWRRVGAGHGGGLRCGAVGRRLSRRLPRRLFHILELLDELKESTVS